MAPADTPGSFPWEALHTASDCQEAGSAGASTGERRRRRQLQYPVLPEGVSTARERSAHSRLPTRPKPEPSSFSRPRAVRASVTFCSVSAARCARGKEGRLAQRPVTIRASELGSPPSRFGRLLGGYRVS